MKNIIFFAFLLLAPAAQAGAVKVLDIKVDLLPGLAAAKYDITYHNTAKTAAPGDFELPLAPGQFLSSFTLETKTKMRPISLAQKPPAPEGGEVFRLSLPPLALGAQRRVMFTVLERLALDSGAYAYRLPPLGPAATLRLRIDLPLQTYEPPIVGGPQGLKFTARSGGQSAHYEARDFEGSGEIWVSVPAEAQPKVYTHDERLTTYFLAAVPPPPAKAPCQLSEAAYDKQNITALRVLPSAKDDGTLLLAGILTAKDAPLDLHFTCGTKWEVLRLYITKKAQSPLMLSDFRGFLL